MLSEVAERERARLSRGGRRRVLAAMGSVARLKAIGGGRKEEGKEGGTEAEPEPRWNDRSNAWVGLGHSKVHHRC